MRLAAAVLALLLTAAPALADSDAERIAELVVANRILADQQILDGFGHVSVRSIERPGHFYMAWARAPGLIEAADIVEYDSECNALNAGGRKLYSERYLHGEIYRARPDVQSVVHSHSPGVIPFSVSSVKLRAVSHMGGFLGSGVPVFEIRSVVGDHSGGMLINTGELGAAVARTLANGTVALIRGHGDVVVGQSIRHAVMHAVYTEFNARIQMDALRLGPVTHLNEVEAAAIAQQNDASVDRPWEIWKRKAMGAGAAP